MRLFFVISCLAVLATTVLAWEKEDHEIFDLVGAVQASEGKKTTFYSWLDVPSTASTGEISKAYRKLSMQLHPDKNSGDEKIAERFARLGVVAAILRNAESRKRYDFFYKNGVPKWRGTGYYYARFRPGLGSVFAFLTIVTSGLQYVIQGYNYRKDLERVERFISEARAAAWGPKQLPSDAPRKVKVSLSGSQRYDEDGRAIGPGRTVDMLVQGQEVYILDPNGDTHLLDSSAATPPSISRLWPFALVSSLVGKVVGTMPHQSQQGAEESYDEKDDVSGSEVSDAPGSGTATPTRQPATKVGGKRKKTAKNR